MNFKCRMFIAMLICLNVSFISGCKEEAPPKKAKTVRPVKVMVIQKGAAQSLAKYPGKIEAGRKVDLSFRVPGPLVNFPVKPGQDLKKGDLVAEIDPRDFKTNLDSARAAYDDTHKSYQRYQKLFKKGAIAKAAYDGSHSAYLRAKAALDQAHAALKDTKLCAPFSGVLAKTYVENHQDIQAKQPIASLQSMSRLEVVVQIPEKDVLLSGSEKEYALSVSIDALPGQEFPAWLKEFTAEADPKTQTFAATVTMERPENFNVLPGMTAELNVRRTLNTSSGDSYLCAPVEAVWVDEKNNRYIWKLDKEKSTVHRIPVKILDLTSDSIKVTDGLTVGDIIATAGVHHLSEGMEVSILKNEEGRCDR